VRRRNRQEMSKTGRVFACIVAMLAVMSACRKEEKESRQTGQEYNPYTAESVYGEVQKKIRDNPKDPDLWFRLADLYDRNGQYADEVEALKKVVELKPDMGYAYFKMGTAYNRLGQHDEAIETFKKTLRYMPDYAVAYNNMAIAYGKTGKTEDEITALKKAIKVRPSYATARYNLGVAYMKTGRRDDAKQEYNELKKIDARLAEALLKEIENPAKGK
jgi:tetratricopeptide (TPR) repeat protein